MTPIPAEFVARASTAYDAVQIVDDTIFWLESRPDGRDVLIQWAAGHDPRELLPETMSVASYVHEYGGGAYLATGDAVWFCNAADQRIYRCTGHGVAEPVTPPAEQPLSIRYADLRLSHDGSLLFAVRERHDAHEVINELVAIPADGNGPARVIEAGWDFYSFPRPSPDGRWLAWTCWNAPHMPWDATWLFVAQLDADGQPGEPIPIAGGPHESVFQPEWSRDGILHFVSDRTGWWNLYTWQNGSISPLLLQDADMAVAQWEFGYSTYAFLHDGRIAVIIQRGGQQELQLLESGALRTVELPYTSLKPYIAAGHQTTAIIASSPDRLPAVVAVGVDTGSVQPLTSGQEEPLGRPVSWPDQFSFIARDGGQVHGQYHRPSDHPDRTPPPLIVKAHPGPTSNAPLRLDWHTQYFTSRGYAVAEVDYRGSTGYGRAYRQALQGRWGILDALDCADAALHLAATGRADPQRTAIWGASAGGYTTLRALTLTDVFAAGIARSPIVSPATWRDAAPKFQAHHADGLIGPWPTEKRLYEQRAVRHEGQITTPLLLLHGEMDPITPASESRALARCLGSNAELIIFPDESHTQRSPDAISAALHAEERFLDQNLKSPMG